jgi:hypothetical protein
MSPVSIALQWSNLHMYGKNMTPWIEVFKGLGRGSILRIGGYSQETLKEVSSKAGGCWDSALQTLIVPQAIAAAYMSFSSPIFCAMTEAVA